MAGMPSETLSPYTTHRKCVSFRSGFMNDEAVREESQITAFQCRSFTDVTMFGAYWHFVEQN